VRTWRFSVVPVLGARGRGGGRRASERRQLVGRSNVFAVAELCFWGARARVCVLVKHGAESGRDADGNGMRSVASGGTLPSGQDEGRGSARFAALSSYTRQSSTRKLVLLAHYAACRRPLAALVFSTYSRCVPRLVCPELLELSAEPPSGAVTWLNFSLV
jgi:hypothetical protein